MSIDRRNVLLAVTALALSGCASVSIYPTQSSSVAVETEPSPLFTATEAFSALAEAEGWVAPSKGLLQAAQSIFDGKPIEGNAAASYADRIGLGEAAPEMVMGRLAGDAQRVQSELGQINLLARQMLDDQDAEVRRADVASYEKSLVWAQRAHRMLASTTDKVLRQSAVPSADVDNALGGLAEEIDRTRKLADALATRFAGLSRSAAS